MDISMKTVRRIFRARNEHECIDAIWLTTSLSFFSPSWSDGCRNRRVDYRLHGTGRAYDGTYARSGSYGHSAADCRAGADCDTGPYADSCSHCHSDSDCYAVTYSYAFSDGYSGAGTPHGRAYIDTDSDGCCYRCAYGDSLRGCGSS